MKAQKLSIIFLAVYEHIFIYPKSSLAFSHFNTVVNTGRYLQVKTQTLVLFWH